MKKQNIELARTLRQNQTDAEKKLWNLLRNRQLADVKFRRQYSIDVYILDFFAPEFRLGVEIDGGQHYEEKGSVKDETRSKKLSQYGIKTLRFSNLDVLNNIEGVYEVLEKFIQNLKNSPAH